MSSNVPVMLPYPCPVASSLIALQDDNTKPAKDPVVRSQTAENVQTPTDLWSLYLQEANDRAKVKVDLWKGSLKAFLLFAGLFAAVVSPFVIDSQARLQSTPSISTLAINFLWFASLTLTLISALAAVLAQTWIVKFSLIPAQGIKGAMERWIRDDGAENWHLHTAITWITAFIQLSLFLFLAGFTVQAMADHRSLGWTILSFVLITLALYLGITVLPWLNPTTPFQTPISELSRRTQNIFLSEVLDLAPTTKAKNRGMWKFIQSIWPNLRGVPLSKILGLAPTSKAENREVLGLAPTTKTKNRGVWKSIQSIWTNLRKTPDKDDVLLGICWSTLKYSSNNVCIHAAVQELTKERINENQSKRLVELGLPEELSFRLAHPPAGLETTVSVVQRMKSYLHVIVWMVDSDYCTPAVARRFSPLIEFDGALLLALDTLPSACRALAFAIRVNLLVNNCKHGKIHGTDWRAMVDGLESNFAFDVFRTAFRGLVIAKDRVTEDFSQTRQDCARMLAAYIGSARFSKEKSKPRITGDPSRIPRSQQEHIKTFLYELEEAWKRSMCTRSIRLMGDVGVNRRIMGSQVLLSVAENETFRKAVTDALPELVSTLEEADREISVDCLDRLSEILKDHSQGILGEAVKKNFSQIIRLLSDSGEEVLLYAVLNLGNRMNMKGWVTKEIKQISANLLRDLSSPYWLTRVEKLDSLADLIKMDEIRTAIIGQERKITDCILFDDEDVRLAAIRTLQELAKDEGFRDVINHNMRNILGLISDRDSTVRAAAIDFVSELSKQASFHTAINGNIYDFMTDDSKSERWFARRDRLQALQKILTSEHPYAGGIQRVLADMYKWLSDSDEDVRQAALEVVSTAAAKAMSAVPASTSSDVDIALQLALKKTISDAIPFVSTALDSSSWIQITALSTLSALAHTGDLTAAIPKIVALFTADEEDVKISALETCAEIAKIQPAALYTTDDSITAKILPALNSSAGWETQVAALKTLSTLAETDELCKTLNDDALDKIFAGLSDVDPDVCAQVLKTLEVLAAKKQFHTKIKTVVRNMLPLLEYWWNVRAKALDTLGVFAKHGILLASDEEIISHLISTASENDTDATAQNL
ncbi:armadillo-type protein, partial [Mycena sanguinolenta]